MVADQVGRARRRFFEPSDFAAPVAAADRALCRLETEGELVRVRKGLYWRGRKTILGMAPPSTAQVLAYLLEDVTYGPSSYSAANLLGLTSQVPARETVAVTGRPPRDLDAVRFTQRSGRRGRNRQRLNAAEIAVLEVLEDWDDLVEVPAAVATNRLRTLIDRGAIRPDALVRAAATEPAVVRDGLARVGIAEPAASAPA